VVNNNLNMEIPYELKAVIVIAAVIIFYMLLIVSPASIDYDG